MKRIVSLLTAILIANLTFSQAPIDQVGVYETYEDYTAGKITKFKEFDKIYHAFQVFTIVFSKEDGTKKKYKLNKKEIWGFQDGKGGLFRLNRKGKPCYVISHGKIIVYETLGTNPRSESSSSVSYCWCLVDLFRV